MNTTWQGSLINRDWQTYNRVPYAACAGEQELGAAFRHGSDFESLLLNVVHDGPDTTLREVYPKRHGKDLTT